MSGWVRISMASPAQLRKALTRWPICRASPRLFCSAATQSNTSRRSWSRTCCAYLLRLRPSCANCRARISNQPCRHNQALPCTLPENRCVLFVILGALRFSVLSSVVRFSEYCMKALITLLACSCVLGAQPQKKNPPAAALAQHPTAIIHTSAGDLKCELFPDKAPNTVANFIGLSTGSKSWTDPRTGQPVHDRALYDGVIF